MINRAAIILKYNQVSIDWINEVDPYGEDTGISIDDVNNDRTVYLISDEDADDQDCLDRWIQANYIALFELELQSWYTDSDLWPSDRDLSIFKKWFRIELHTVIVDTVRHEIIDEDAL